MRENYLPNKFRVTEVLWELHPIPCAIPAAYRVNAIYVDLAT